MSVDGVDYVVDGGVNGYVDGVAADNDADYIVVGDVDSTVGVIDENACAFGVVDDDDYVVGEDSLMVRLLVLLK